MDSTPISARRVVLGFALTAFVALLPVLFLLLESGSVPWASMSSAAGGYRGLLIGAGSVVAAALLIGAASIMVLVGRRVVRRPSRA